MEWLSGVAGVARRR